MDEEVLFFVAFTAILLVSRYLPLALPLNRRLLLADNAATPAARTAKCAVSVAIGGLSLLVSMQSSGGGGGPVAMGAKVLWFNFAALFLGTLLLVAFAVAPAAARFPPPFVQMAIEHLAVATELVAINAFAHNLCAFLKMFMVYVTARN